MPTKTLGLAIKSVLLSLLVFSIISCDDTTDTIGWEIMPESDAIFTDVASFDVKSESIMADSVYARTETGYLGRYSDPEFGYYEASFLAELNCTEDYKFPELYKYDETAKKATGMMAGDSCTNIKLVVYYSKWFGDSLTANTLSAYKLNERWLDERNGNGRFYRYTNIDTDKYYNKSDLLGTKAYTAHDFSVSDDERNGTDSDGLATYYPNVTIELDKEIGQNILQLNRTHPEYFKNAQTFIENVFPGVYLKTSNGDGTILYVDYVALQMQFRFHYLDDDGVALKKTQTDDFGTIGDDSLYYSAQTLFASSREIIQANKFTNSDKLKEKIKETENTYIKSPAGIFTSLTLPYDEIYAKLANDSLNAAKLSITNYEQVSDYDFSMEAPQHLLLIRKKDMKRFFENNELADSKTTFTTTHNATENNKYVFNNIARLITTAIKEKREAKAAVGLWTSEMENKWVEENTLLLVPVELTTYTDPTTYQTSTIGLQHDLEPTYSKLVGGTATENNRLKNPLKLDITFTRIKQ